MERIARRMRPCLRGEGNVFAAATAMAVKYGSVNLGQGFPSFPTPDFVKQAACDAINTNNNQYARPGGHPLFIETLSRFYEPRFQRKLDPMQEIVTCNGGQEGIYNVLATYCNENDEVLCIEPYFDVYKKASDLVGAKAVGVPLRLNPNNTSTAASFHLDLDELESKITDKTKLLVLNTPHNPTGKVFSLDEMKQIAQIVERHPQLLVLSDEVYEFMTFDGIKHERFALLPGMWDRTISLFSAGKTFSCTGWRVGYCIGPKELITPLIHCQSIVAFCSAAPLEVAVAHSFDHASKINYFDQLSGLLSAKRDVLCDTLAKAGMNPIVPQGGYFVIASTDKIPVTASNNLRRDYVVNEWLTKNIGITGIPISGFYSEHNRHLADSILRFAYCKTDDDLSNAAKRLESCHL